MDALEFLKERKRMCNSYKGCEGCPLAKGRCVIGTSDEDCERILVEVEKWAKEHPRKTRQRVFLEQWPNCMLNDDGTIRLCPRNVDKNYTCNLIHSVGCTDCRREFWMQEVE